MLLTSWLSAFKTLGAWNRPVRRARKMNLASGLMEHLEDRCLLSSFYVSTTGDDSNDGSAATPYRTVQKAIDAANAASDGDDFVKVAAGTYNTLADIGWTVVDSTNITNLSITGGWDSSFTTRTPLSTIWAPGAYAGAPASGAQGDINLVDANTTIDGFYFAFDGDGVGGTGGTRISGGIVVQNTGITISNNTVEVGSKNVSGGARSTGIQTSGSDTSNLLISGNTFTEEGLIQGQGIFLNPGVGTNTQIIGNTFSGSKFATILVVKERGDVSIANNVFTAATGFQTIDVRTANSATPITNLSITGNTIDGGGMGLGIHIGDGTGTQAITGFVISNNIITNHGTGNGIFIGPGTTQAGAISGTISYNSITEAAGTGIGLTTLGAGSDTIDASRNWWGDVSGPTLTANSGGLGSTITGTPSIKFAPWLIYSPDTNPALAGVQLPTTVTVTPGSDTSAADNDFTRLQNAIGAATTGQTIDIKGLYNWNSTNSGAAYLASTNTSDAGDIRGLVLPGGVDNLTITSSDSSAHIIGQGDLLDGNYDSFLFNAGGTVPVNVNLTVEKLNIDNFENAVAFDWDGAVGPFDGTRIQNNQVTIGGDNEGTQNIAFYFTRGINQHITGNTVTFQADGILGTAGRSYGFQNDTIGGTAYDGLLIDSNIFQIAATANGEIVTGVRENSHNDDNASDISITQNQFLGIQGVRDFDRGLMLTSQSTGLIVDGNLFTDVDDVFFARDASGGTDPGDQFTFTNNVLTRVGGADGIFLRNVTTDPTPTHVVVNWNINNTVDGFTGVRGLNELSVNAAATSRPLTGASDLNSVNAIGAKTTVFVDDDSASAPRFSDPDGIDSGVGPAAAGFNAFSTLTAGVAAVDAGGTVNVAAGTYKENLTIGKSVTISGPNTGINGAGTRSAEAHVVSDATSSFQNAVFKVTANNVTIQGLEIDGDDPLVTGFANTSGADTNTSYAVQAVGVTGGLAVRNNIAENVFIGVRGDGASQGNVIDSNWFHDIGVFDFGYGVTLRTDFYADITNNLMTKVHLGVHTNNMSAAGGPAAWNVTGNEFHTYAGGIWDNQQYSSATPMTIDNNQLFAEAGALADNFGIQLVGLQTNGGVTITNTTITGTDYGIIAWADSPTNTPTLGSTVSIVDTKVGVYATNNLAFNAVGTTVFGVTAGPTNLILDGVSITGSTLQAVSVFGQTSGGAVNVTVQNDTELTGSASATDTGILVSGSKATATIQDNDASIHGFNIGIDVDAAAATITNNHIYDNTTGIRFTNGGNGSVSANNFDGLVDNGTDLRLDATAGTVNIGTGNIFAGDSLFIDNRTGQAYDLTSYTSANWEGLIDPFLIEGKIVHAPDTGTTGLIRVIAGHVYVTSPGTGLTDESIQAAINAASSGDTINVASGTFVGNLIVDKSLNLVGPNAAIDPNTGTRVGEAILLPGVTETSVQGSTSGVIVRVGTGSGHVDVTVSGFTIDGHNAALSGGRTLNGVEVNTGAGIANSIGSFDTNPGGYDATLNVQNNIIQNLERYGVLVDGVNSPGLAVTGNDISHNKIDNLPSGNNFGGDRGRAMAFEVNVYGTVSYNVVTRVNVGWQDDNYTVPSPGAGTLVDHNTISTYHRGIFHNLAYLGASDITISNNTISVETSGDFPATSSNFGIELASIGGTVGASVTDNTISGMVYGILLWGTTTTGNVTVSGGTLTGNHYGILATNNDPQFGIAPSAQGTISDVTIVDSSVAGIAVDSSAAPNHVALTIGSGNSVTGGPVGLLVNGPDTEIVGNTLNDLKLSGQSGNYITLEDGALDDEVINATGVKFDGLLPAAMTTAQKFATEAKIQDQYDDATLGLIQITAGVYYVTPATSPTANDNDYTRLANIMNVIADGDTVILSGTFDWSEPNASASWALGNDGVAGGFDDYSLYVPTNVNDVTWTSDSLGAARIQGPGDLAGVNLEGVFLFDGTDSQGWTISNLEIYDFDLSIAFFFGGGPDEYAGTTITNNHIRVPADLNTTVAPADVNQNIGIHFSFGTNQTISNNIIDIDGSGVSDGANFSSSVAMQSNSGGGTSFDGLLIDNNTINVTGVLNAQPSSIRGIWENGNASQSDITVSNNDFNNLTGNNGATNLMRAFIITSHSSATTTVSYEDNTVTAANVGFQWLPGGSFGGNQPVQLTGNMVTDTQIGVQIQSNGSATLTGNLIDGVAGTSMGVSIAAGSSATLFENDISGASVGVDNSGILDSVTENFIRNNTGDGIRLETGSQVSGTIFNNNLSGNTGFALNNLTATPVNASGNSFGVTTPAAVAAKVNGLVDYSPWLNFATDTDLLTAGFQGDFSSLSVYQNTVQFTATGLIQEAVNLLADGALTGTARTINVDGGIYSDAANLNQAVTLVLGGNVRVPGLDSIVGTIIDLQSNTLSLGSGNVDNTLAGNIQGSGGGLVKQGSAILQLTGTDTYTGTTAVNTGTLQVDGSTTSPTSVFGTLTGSGSIAAAVSIENGGGTVSPGGSGTAILHTGALTVSIGATFTAQVNGRIAGSQADQIATTGVVDITNATLDVSGTITSLIGQVITLIDNGSGSAVVGEFAGHAEGSTVTINGVDFILSYHGGTGNNDVTLSEPPLVVSIDDVSVSESAGNMVFNVNLDKPLDIDFVLDVTFQDGTATGGGTDYTSTTQHINITAGQQSAQVTVPINNDAIVEGTEGFTVHLSTTTDLGGRGIDFSDVGAGTITDDDSATVSIAKTFDGAEGAIPVLGQFTVSLSAVSSTDTVVTYDVSGTAIPGAGNDYSTLSGSVTIPAGQLTAVINVPVLNDTIVEGTESVIATLTGFGAHDPQITLGAPNSATVNIADDDTDTLQISSPTVTEGNAGPATLTFTVTSPTAVAGGFTVAFNVADITTNGSDYTVVTTSPLTFTGTAGETHTITINVNGDTIVEGNETLSVTLGTVTPVAPVPASSIVTGAVGTGTITNDDSDTLTISSPIVTEGNAGTTTMTFTVTSPNAVAGGFTVAFNVANGTTNGSDYAVITSSPLTFAGTAGETQTITIDVNGDTIVEGNETLTVTLGTITPVAPVQAASIVTGAIGTGTITNDDTDTLTISSPVVTEGDAGTTTMTFTVTSPNAVAGGFTVAFDVANGTADDADYSVVTSSPLTFAGNAGETQTITINVTGDLIVEANETLTVTLGTVTPVAPVAAASIVTGAAGTGTINDNDSATVSVAKITDGAETNTPTSGKFTVTQSAVSSTDTVVSYSITGSATAGSDYTTLTGTVTIPAGQTSADIDVAVLTDNIVEATETVIVTLTGITSGDPQIAFDATPATVNITDNDTATFTIDNVTVNEAAGTLVFTLATDKALDINVIINVAFGGGTATGGGTDYASTTQSITFLAGQTSQQVSVAINDDSIVEATETFNASLSTNAVLGGRSVNLSDTGTGTITDNDTANFTINNVTVGEGAGNLVFDLVTDKALDIDVTITVTFSDVTATGGGIDYSSTTQQITFLAGELSKQVSVAINNDSLVEGTETFTAALSSTTPLGGRVIDVTDSGTGTITDNDTATVSIAKITDGTESETPTNGQFTVTLSAPSSTDTVVNYTITGTAMSGIDYTALTGSVTIPAGQTTANIDVTVLDDATVEDIETVIVTLDGFGAHDSDITLGANVSATVSISDDDQLVITSASSVSVEENSLTSTVVLNVDADPVAGHALTYSLSGPDAARFNINSATGEITFVNSPNFEAPADQGANNVYNITVSVTSDITPTRTTTQDLTITVTPVNDLAPVFDDASPTFSIPENSPVGTVVGGVSATDGDLPVQSLTYSIIGGNSSGAFTINSTTGQITVADATPLNFEVTPNFTLQIRVTDNGSPTPLTTDAMVEIHLTDVGPTITLPGTPATYTLHTAPVLIAPTATFTFGDVATPNFSDAKLTVSIIAGRDKRDRLAIIKKGDSTGDIHLKGKKVLAGDVQIGTVAGGHGRRTPDLVVTLNSNATQATVERLLERVTFQAKAGMGITRTVSMKLTNVSGVDSNVGTRDITVN